MTYNADDLAADRTGTSVTTAALTALTDLVDTARAMADEAPNAHLRFGAHDLARTLDGARTSLIQEGPDYLDAAWAFIDAGRKLIATTRINFTRAARANQ